MIPGGENKFTNATSPLKDLRTIPAPLTMRTLFIGIISIVAVISLLWMWQDQNKVFECTWMGHQRSAMPSQRQNPPPVINIQINDTKPAKKNSYKDTWDYNWDKLQWKHPEDAKRARTRTIILIRHGQYHVELSDKGKLTHLGREQADLTGQRLKEMNYKYTSITHSTLIRAKETADIIRKYLPDVPTSSDDMIQEGGPVKPSPTVSWWGLPDRDYFRDGPRLEAAFRKYFHRAHKRQRKHTYEILVGHTNIFTFFTLRAVQLPAEAWMRIFLPHGSITVIDISADSTVTVESFGEAGYMPHNKITY